MEEGTSISPRHPEGTTPPHRVEPAQANRVEQTQACELRDLLDRLADKWSLLVLELLSDGQRRFSQLRREIDEISQRMLTTTLRRLERDGLVLRTVHAVVPPQVDYEITPLGTTLLAAVEPLLTWSRDHRSEVDGSRTSFDGRNAGPTSV